MPKRRRIPTVLVIEDDIDIQNFIARVLELEGYNPIKAMDGNTGVEILREYPIDLVILDIRLPGTDGWPVIQELKQTAGLTHIPVIVLTAIVESATRRRALRMGVDLYLIKPLSARRLSTAIASVMGNKVTGQLALEENAGISR
jgi:two-component system cell cycle response regulator